MHGLRSQSGSCPSSATGHRARGVQTSDGGMRGAAASLRMPLRFRYYRCIMKSLGWMRRGSWLVLLLAAALVVVPAADCLLFDGHGRTVDHHVAAAEGADAAAGHEHVVSADAEQCAAHAVHGPAKALPPGIVSMTLAALILAAATSVFPAVSARTAGTGGVRGPPLRPARPDGRAVLTLHCISRR